MGGLPFIIWRLNKRTVFIVLSCYIVAVLMVTLGSRSFDNETRMALNPFHEYLTIIRIVHDGYAKNGLAGAWKRLWIYRHAVFTPLLNILMFIPLGYMIPLVLLPFRRIWKVLEAGFLFSLLIETIQFFAHLGWFDVADLMHNALGTGIGCWIFQRWLNSEECE